MDPFSAYENPYRSYKVREVKRNLTPNYCSKCQVWYRLFIRNYKLWSSLLALLRVDFSYGSLWYVYRISKQIPRIRNAGLKPRSNNVYHLLNRVSYCGNISEICLESTVQSSENGLSVCAKPALKISSVRTYMFKGKLELKNDQTI